jgi:ABC-2 type transport system permease protein
MNTNIWLIRREFWENRAIWMIPAVFGALLIVAALFGQIHFPELTSPKVNREFGAIFLVIIGLLFYTVMSVYATWYLLDCLYADRKDRSILFWKSLPLSDAKTVLNKLAVGLIIIPLVYFVAADVTALLTAFILSVRARSSIGGALWQGDWWWQIQVLWIYAIVTTAVWYLPVAGWLLVVSAWAKRAVMLWAVLPPLVLYLIERVFFGTHVVAHLLAKRLVGLPAVALRGSGGQSWSVSGTGDASKLNYPSSVWDFINVGGFFSNPHTLIGLAVGVVLIIAAIQLRIRRTEI